MDREYSASDAKARFSEILRAGMNGERVLIRYRGRPVAEVRPLEPPPMRLVDRLADLERRGILMKPAAGPERLLPLTSRAGALQRFLDERD